MANSGSARTVRTQTDCFGNQIIRTVYKASRSPKRFRQDEKRKRKRDTDIIAAAIDEAMAEVVDEYMFSRERHHHV